MGEERSDDSASRDFPRDPPQANFPDLSFTAESNPPADSTEDAYLDVLTRLCRVAELRDYRTGSHAWRVADLSVRIARELGLPPVALCVLRRVAPVHDVGKLVIPDRILLKRGSLTEGERAVVQRHTIMASEILGPSARKSRVMRVAELVARHHHERWDGRGYPDHLAGKNIPLLARIVAVADAFDAMTHDRPYRPAISLSSVLTEIDREAGRQFDPRVAEALLSVLDKGPCDPCASA